MFEWRSHNPVTIHFGSGIINNLSDFGSGKAILITTSGSTRRGLSRKVSKLIGTSLVAIFDRVEPNPTFATIALAYRELKQLEYDFIIAVGGGSAVDTAKAVATHDAVEDDGALREVLKSGVDIPVDFDPKPVVAVPTTAGTGSEVTRWATIWDTKEKKKYSLSHPRLYPETALLDPQLTLTLPEKETVYAGLDALSHAMEAIWNKNHNPVSDMFALSAIELIRKYLPELRHNLGNIDLRAALLRASLFAGLAFSNTKTAIAHSISYPLTANFGIPHGLACALPLPHVLRFNGKKDINRIGVMAEALGASRSSESMAKEVMRLFDQLDIAHHLADYGIDNNYKALISKSAFTPGRADNNIIELNSADIANLIDQLL